MSSTPAANAVFDGWDDGNTDNPRSVVVNQDLTFTANFSLMQTYTIIVVSDNPLMDSVYGGGNYFENQVVNIGAVPNPGFFFAGWQDGIIDNPRTITVTSNATFTASFAAEPTPYYTVTAYYSEDQGFVIGSGSYVAGSTATLAAIPADGYVFDKWSDETTDNPKQVLVNHDIVLTAYFLYTSVDEYDGKTLTLYPNPATDMIRIEGLEGENEISIYNALGLLVKTEKMNGDQEIAIHNLPAGLYLLRINASHTVRFVKK